MFSPGRIRLLAIVIVPLILMIISHSCMTFRMSPKEIDNFFSSREIRASRHSYKIGTRKIHYVKAGDETKPVVIFLHGSPGSLSAFIGFLTDTVLLKNALLISVDRPGFGESNFGIAEPSLGKQGELLIPILEEHKNNRPIVLVGHSLAGPLIAKMALDFPELVDGLILVAPSMDPALEPNESWFRAPLATPFLSWILPRSIRASNEEIYYLKPELEEMQPLLSSIKCPVTVIQGDNDSLVPAANADFVQTQMNNSSSLEIILQKDMDHFVPWTHPHLITNAIIGMLGTIEADVNLTGH